MYEPSQVYDTKETNSATAAAMKRPFLSMETKDIMYTTWVQALLRHYRIMGFKEDFERDLDIICDNEHEGQAKAYDHFSEFVLLYGKDALEPRLYKLVQGQANKLSLLADFAYWKCHSTNLHELLYDSAAELSYLLYKQSSDEDKEECIKLLKEYNVVQGLESFFNQYTFSNPTYNSQGEVELKNPGTYELKNDNGITKLSIACPDNVAVSLEEKLTGLYEAREWFFDNPLAMVLLNRVTILYGKLVNRFNVGKVSQSQEKQFSDAGLALEEFINSPVIQEINEKSGISLEQISKPNPNELRAKVSTDSRQIKPYRFIEGILKAFELRAETLDEQEKNQIMNMHTFLKESFERIRDDYLELALPLKVEGNKNQYRSLELEATNLSNFGKEGNLILHQLYEHAVKTRKFGQAFVIKYSMIYARIPKGSEKDLLKDVKDLKELADKHTSGAIYQRGKFEVGAMLEKLGIALKDKGYGQTDEYKELQVLTRVLLMRPGSVDF
ncbi:hypothetical protein KY330_03515 [Candidatus Woesearchaeota archaeon]|nr:hypothetical protein [Candidatus Woesearchaeota archaeon]